MWMILLQSSCLLDAFYRRHFQLYIFCCYLDREKRALPSLSFSPLLCSFVLSVSVGFIYHFLCMHTTFSTENLVMVVLAAGGGGDEDEMMGSSDTDIE